jgi:cytochrome c2
MRTISIFLFAMFVGAGAAIADGQDQTRLSAIAGRNIATTKCIACHVVTPGQALPPVLGPGIPTFAEIANRPNATAESLSQAMKTARWHDYALPSTLLPMSRLSDNDREQVVTFILSLRDHHD